MGSGKWEVGSDLTTAAGRRGPSGIALQVVSPAGLAPARPGVKGRLRDSLHSGTTEVRSAKAEVGNGRSRFLPTSHFQLPTLNWLPDPDSHRDRRLNRPPCYFDTIRQETSGGANAGRGMGKRTSPSLVGESAVGTGESDGTGTCNPPADSGTISS